MGEKIRDLCCKHNIDMVLCAYIFQSKLLEYVPNHILKAIDTHDKMSDRYAMLRANKSSHSWFSCTPEDEGRLQILKILTKNMPLAKYVNLSSIAKKTSGYTGADLELLVREAAMIALRENKEAKVVETGHFEEAIKKVRPSVSKPLLEVYKKIEDTFLKSAKSAIPLENSYLG